ncbi:MAG: phosphoribosyl-AMP cyclohydrolase [Desulfobacterium sp.]|nr:phosphoribosyl-AMP cyclohydrolase [Desulfobacterium sp.]
MDGLLPAIVQDYETGEVLMLAFMNEEAWESTLSTGRATYYSRSRQKLWIKGETSGHIQMVREIRIDCDNDTVLLKVKQVGDAACHTGYKSCFHKKIENGSIHISGKLVFDPKEVYKK